MNKALAELDNAIKCARLQEGQALGCTVEWLEMIQESIQEALEGAEHEQRDAQYWKVAAETQKENNIAILKEVERLRKMYEREREIAEQAQKNAESWKEYGENELRTNYTLIFNLQKKENLLTHAIQSLESIRDHSTDKDSARAASEAVKLIKRIQEGKQS